MTTETRTHSLKTWQPHYNHLVSGDKTFEFRKNDRNYRVGDFLELMEYNSSLGILTGRASLFLVTYILKGGEFGMPKEYCIMSVKYIKVSGEK